MIGDSTVGKTELRQMFGQKKNFKKEDPVSTMGIDYSTQIYVYNHGKTNEQNVYVKYWDTAS